MIFWGQYEAPFGTSIQRLNICVNGYYTAADEMIARQIIVRFCIFNLLKYDRIFSKNMQHDGVK